MVLEGSDDEPPPSFHVPLGTNQTEPTSETENQTRDSNPTDRPKTTTVSMGEEEEEDCLQEKLTKFSEEEVTRASSSSAALEEERQVSGVGVEVVVVNSVSDEMLLCVDEQLDFDSSEDSD